ncbi:MAG: proton-conducting transporter membrane subunit, partial [Myxococcota bacterium]
MSDTVWWGATGPLALLLAALVSTRGGWRGARAAARLNLGLALGAVAWVIAHGPVRSSLLGVHGFGVSLVFDPLGVSLFAMVALLGVVLVRFSERYLHGDPRQLSFAGWLSAALATVQLLVVSGNLVGLFVAWVGSSLFFHRLLTFFQTRPRARLGGRKKWWTMRIGDAALAGAFVLLAQRYQTGEIAAVLEGVSAESELPATVAMAAGLLVAAAALKSVQFPLHGWILDVVEAPTPVSALLHAGIVNGGGFLLLRFLGVVSATEAALVALAIIG